MKPKNKKKLILFLIYLVVVGVIVGVTIYNHVTKDYDIRVDCGNGTYEYYNGSVQNLDFVCGKRVDKQNSKYLPDFEINLNNTNGIQ